MLLLDIITPETFGYLAALLVFLAFCMKTMLSLRLVAIASNIAFILYALPGHHMPILVLHGALLPLNVFRLVQMLRQVRLASVAARLDPAEDKFEWLIPFGNTRTLPSGAMVFSKGETADSLFIVIEGEVLIPEVGATLGPNTMIGEISLFSGDRRRTASARAVGRVRLAEITEQQVQKLYFDNPHFAYRLIRLVSRRLVDHLGLLERTAEARLAQLNEPQSSTGK